MRYLRFCKYKRLCMTEHHSLTEKEKKALFNKEFLPYMTDLYNFAYYLTKDAEESKDLVQETFMRAYEHIHQYQAGTNAKAWLIRILKNSFINRYRKKRRTPDQIPYEEYRQKADPPIIDTEKEIFDSPLSGEVAAAFNSLPPDYRLIIYLADVMDFKYEEIAHILDIPVGTVRSRLHRARNTLRKMLLDYARSMGYPVESPEVSEPSSTGIVREKVPVDKNKSS